MGDGEPDQGLGAAGLIDRFAPIALRRQVIKQSEGVLKGRQIRALQLDNKLVDVLEDRIPPL